MIASTVAATESTFLTFAGMKPIKKSSPRWDWFLTATDAPARDAMTNSPVTISSVKDSDMCSRNLDTTLANVRKIIMINVTMHT